MELIETTQLGEDFSIYEIFSQGPGVKIFGGKSFRLSSTNAYQCLHPLCCVASVEVISGVSVVATFVQCIVIDINRKVNTIQQWVSITFGA